MAIGVKVVKGSAQNARKRRHFRVRKRVVGSAERPRLVVSRSSRHLVAQIVDDSIGQTLVSASTMELGKCASVTKINSISIDVLPK